MSRAAPSNQNSTTRVAPVQDPAWVDLANPGEVQRLGHQIDELMRIKCRIATEIAALKSEHLAVEAKRCGAAVPRESEEDVQVNVKGKLNIAGPTISSHEESGGGTRRVEHANGLGHEGTSSEMVVHIQAGPVPDLASVSRLEDELLNIASVKDVYVRRVEGEIAVIELLLDGNSGQRDTQSEIPLDSSRPRINGRRPDDWIEI